VAYESRRSGDRLHPVLPNMAARGLVGPAATGTPPSRSTSRAPHPHPVPLSADELERYYGASPTRRSGRLSRRPSRRRSTSGAGATPTGWSTSASRRRGRGRGPGRDGLGAGLPAFSWCPGHASASCAPTCGSGSSCTSRSRRSSCSCRLPFRAEVLRACSAPTWVGFQQRLAAQKLRPPRPAPARSALRGPVDPGGRAQVKAGAFPISIDTREMERMAADPGAGPGQGRSAPSWATPRRSSSASDRLDYTKGHRAAPQGVPRAARRRQAQGRRRRDGAGRDPEPRSASSITRRCASRWSARWADQRRASPGFGVAGGALPAQSYSRQELAAMYVGADVMMLHPLRDGMNLVAKEYVACRPNHRRRSCSSEFAGPRRPSSPGLPLQPRTIPTASRSRCCGGGRRAGRAQAADAVMQRHLRTHDVREWGPSLPGELGVDDHRPLGLTSEPGNQR